LNSNKKNNIQKAKKNKILLFKVPQKEILNKIFGLSLSFMEKKYLYFGVHFLLGIMTIIMWQI